MNANKTESTKIIENTAKYVRCILGITRTVRKCKSGKEVKRNTCTIIGKNKRLKWKWSVHIGIQENI